jgi:DNA-binding NarL/FixJ family response regulator
MISIAIVEDHQVLSDTLGLMFRREPELQFLGSANTLASGKELVRSNPPDVLLLDIGLPDGDGLDLIPLVKQTRADTQVVILTSLTDETTLMRAIDHGVNGFVSKSSSLPDFASTIRQAADGEIVIPNSLLMGLLMRMPRDKAASYREEKGYEPLTLREREILESLAAGKSGSAIAEEMHIAPLTVRTHIRNLMSKLGVHSRLEAVAFGLKHGIIDSPA